MLPSLGFNEIVILCVLALIVVGPKDLPLMLRKLGRWTAKLRSMANEFRTGMDELARQAELDELKKEVDSLRRNQILSDIDRDLRRPFDIPQTSPPSPPAALPAPDAAPAVPHDVAHGAPVAEPKAVEAKTEEAADRVVDDESPQAAPPLARSAT